MKIRNTPERPVMRLNSLILVGVLILVAAVVAVPFYSAQSSSLSTGVIQPSVPSRASAKVRQMGSVSKANQVSWSSIFRTLLSAPQQQSVEGIATFNSDCVTPQSDFFLGDVVCAKASGVPDTLFPWQVLWVDPGGLIRQSNNASTNDSTTYLYTLPATPTSNVNGETVDNRGSWEVDLARSNGAIRQTARFVVHELNNPVADVSVGKAVRTASGSVASGENISFFVVVSNAGPDIAANIHLVDSVPTGATLVQFTQNSGPQCLPVEQGGPANDCIIAAMNNGDRAEFTAIYNTGSQTPGDYTTSASVSSTTTDPNSSNNTSTALYTVTASNGGTTCQVICPDNITTPANTTEGGQRGAHVNYDPPVTSGDCGSVTSTPASGSFFPVGTTTVNATSETGGGACSFTVTVEEHGGTASITCPDNITADADSDCSATVNVGTPTAAGDNITLFATRSDGRPMYNCDANGNCTRLSSDAPFPAGTTTITWFAYSHDVAGPYTTPGPNCPGPNCSGDTFEEQHRTSSASCTQTVTVNDVTPPVITATDSSASADANCQAPIPDYSNQVTDNCACAANDSSQDCVGQHRINTTQTPAAGTMVGLGPHTVHITANDGSSSNNGAGNTTTKDVTFTVNDTTPPVITCPANQSNIPTEPGTCAASVNPGTATATDNCDSNPTITASRSDGRPLTDTYPKGTTTITWTATDASGNHSSCQQTIIVVDNQPPVIVLNGQTPSMWPPNHKYQTFTVANFVASVTDNCDSIGVSSVFITKVTSDEIENGNGDGNTLNDIVIASDCKSIQLRSEREGNGDGRVYTIYFKVVDSSGNVGTATAKVVVQHNPGQTVVDSGPHYTVMSSCP